MVEPVSSATTPEVSLSARQQARPAEDAPPPRSAERAQEAPPPRQAETKVTLSQSEPQPNTADRNAKPAEMYRNVSVLR